LDFWERRKKQQLEEDEKTKQMEKEIWEELRSHIDAKEERRKEIDEEGSLSEWSGEEEMQVERDGFDEPQNRQAVGEELQQAFEEQRKAMEELRQVQKEKKATFFGGTPVHFGKMMVDKEIVEQGRMEDVQYFVDDEQALNKLLNIRSFKEIQSILNERRTKAEIEQDLKNIKPVKKLKSGKSDTEKDEIES
jgi:hypothetical protein